MFRDLIPLLADRFHIVAPDLPGFGNSDMPDRANTFDQIADDDRSLHRSHRLRPLRDLCVRLWRADRFRLAVEHPERITAIISQNGNAYEEG